MSAFEAEIRATFQNVTGSARTAVTAPTPMPSPPSTGTGVVINEFRTRGPQGGNDEFIELRNDSQNAVNISGWLIDGSNGSAVTEVRGILPNGIILNAGCHYLLANSNTNGYSGPRDETYGVGITDDGGIALKRPDGTVVDAVGMSNGSAFNEGTPLADFGDANSDRSYKRTGNDTNNNRNDFVLSSPSTPITMSGSCSTR